MIDAIEFSQRLIRCPSITPAEGGALDLLQETLEEIGIRAKEDFIAAGGEDLRLVPCLNADADWVDVVAQMVRATSD